MKGGVEHRDVRDIAVRDIAERVHGRPNPGEVLRVVERRERDAALDRREDLGVDPSGVVEVLATVDHAMADRVDHMTVNRAEDLRDRIAVRHRISDPLDRSRDERLRAFGIDELILDARAPQLITSTFIAGRVAKTRFHVSSPDERRL